MKVTNKIRILSLLVGIVMVLSACPKKAPEQLPDLLWPPPPQKTRIKFVKILRGELDYNKPSSAFEKLFGKKGTEVRLTQLIKPFDIVADTSGNIYVSDTGYSAIFVFDENKKEVRLFGNKGQVKLNKPLGMDIDDQNYIYVADSINDRVVVFDTEGNLILTIKREPEMLHPTSVAVDNKNKILYVSSTRQSLIHMFTLSGRYIRTFGGLGSQPGKFNRQSHLKVDREGRLYVSDTINCRYQVFSPKAGELLYTNGTRSTKMGGFVRPKGIEVDRYGHVYVADAAFDNVQIFNQNRQLLLFFGYTGKFGRAQFQNPNGIFIDNNDRIYVADAINARIQIFDYVGGPDDTQPKVDVPKTEEPEADKPDTGVE